MRAVIENESKPVISSGAGRSQSERCGVEGHDVRLWRQKAGPSMRAMIGFAIIVLGRDDSD